MKQGALHVRNAPYALMVVVRRPGLGRRVLVANGFNASHETPGNG